MSDRLVSSLLFRRGRSVQRLRKTDHRDKSSNHIHHTLPPSPLSSSSYQQRQTLPPPQPQPQPRLDAKKRFAKVISCLRFIHKGKRNDRNAHDDDIETTMNNDDTVASQRFMDEALPSPPPTPQQQICSRNELQRTSAEYHPLPSPDIVYGGALSPPPRHHRTVREQFSASMFEDHPERYNDNETPYKIRKRPALLKRTASMNGHLRLSIDVDQHYNTSSAITDASSTTDDVTTTAASSSFLPTQPRSIPISTHHHHHLQSLADPSSIVTDSSSTTADESLFCHGPFPSSTLLPLSSTSPLEQQQQHQQDELGSSTTTVVDDDKAQYDAVVAGTIGRSSRVRKPYCQRSWIANAIAST